MSWPPGEEPVLKVFAHHRLVAVFPAGSKHRAEGPPGREELVISSADGAELRRFGHGGWHGAGLDGGPYRMICAGPEDPGDCPYCGAH